jgi:hypothetical protein
MTLAIKCELGRWKLFVDVAQVRQKSRAGRTQDLIRAELGATPQKSHRSPRKTTSAEPDVRVVLPRVRSGDGVVDICVHDRAIAFVHGDEVRCADVVLEARKCPASVADGLVTQLRVAQVTGPVGNAID